MQSHIARLTGHSDHVRSVAYGRELLVSGGDESDRSIRIWEMQLNGHAHCVTSVATFGSTIVSGGLDSTVRIWDMTTGTQQQMYNLIYGRLWVVCSPDEKGPSGRIIIASGGSVTDVDRSIWLWDMHVHRAANCKVARPHICCQFHGIQFRW